MVKQTIQIYCRIKPTKQTMGVSNHCEDLFFFVYLEALTMYQFTGSNLDKTVKYCFCQDHQRQVMLC